MRVRTTGDRDGDMIYQLEGFDDGSPYRDPDRVVETEEDSWWFEGHDLKDKKA